VFRWGLGPEWGLSVREGGKRGAFEGVFRVFSGCFWGCFRAPFWEEFFCFVRVAQVRSVKFTFLADFGCCGGGVAGGGQVFLRELHT
jgi:hypothetical protein